MAHFTIWYILSNNDKVSEVIETDTEREAEAFLVKKVDPNADTTSFFTVRSPGQPLFVIPKSSVICCQIESAGDAVERAKPQPERPAQVQFRPL